MDEPSQRALARSIILKRRLVALKAELDDARRFYHRLYQGLSNPCELAIGEAVPGYGQKLSLPPDSFPSPRELSDRIRQYQLLHRELEELKQSVPPEVRAVIEGNRPGC